MQQKTTAIEHDAEKAKVAQIAFDWNALNIIVTKQDGTERIIPLDGIQDLVEPSDEKPTETDAVHE